MENDFINKKYFEDLKEKYVIKMQEAINNNDEETGHMNCDDILCDLLNELGFNEIIDIYNMQDKWFA